MKSVVLYLHVHQPYRVKQYSVFDIAKDHLYFNDEGGTDLNNRRVFEKIADKSYRPMNALLEKKLTENPEFKLSLSITGTFLEQAEAWAPDVIDSFKRLVDTGRVEILGETYHHSLAFFYSKHEFEKEVNLHREKIFKTFGVVPSVFRNTELAYNDEVGIWAEQHGYRAVLAEGWDPLLEWRSPNYVYSAAGTSKLKLLLKNYRLSDDLAFRFSDTSWKEYPLTADKYAHWLADTQQDEVINLFMDYETFGEHQWLDTGIFDFVDQFVGTWLSAPDHNFMTVSDAAKLDSKDEISFPYTVSWADNERDLSAWNGNFLQQEALRHSYALEHDVLHTGDADIIGDWRKLLSSDQTYYMATKWSADGNVHAYFSPYDSPYDAFLSYMNAVRDIRWRVIQHRSVA